MNKKKVIILTGDEIRHNYFRKKLSNDQRFNVIASFCEGNEKSLEARTFSNASSSSLERLHVLARKQSEIDFFEESINNLQDLSNPIKIKKGQINDGEITNQIIALKPDLIVCFGASLIKSKIVDIFSGKFLNVHLGLSPYYRGSGTNVWPIINNELYLVGATFMYLDSGIDTGEIIHQISADICLGDSPHSIGNRLIKKMTKTYAEIIANFNELSSCEQPELVGKLYKISDFDADACYRLYERFKEGIIESFLTSSPDTKGIHLVKNKGLG